MTMAKNKNYNHVLDNDINPLTYFGYADTVDSATRKVKYKKQRRTRGFDDSEVWNLDCSLARYILPRLKRFKKITHGHPSSLESFEAWKEILDKMILSFQLIKDGSKILLSDKEEITLEEYIKYEEEREAKIQEGIDLFAKYFRGLWD